MMFEETIYQDDLANRAWDLLQECRLRAFGWKGYGLGYDVLHPNEERPLGCILERKDGWIVLFPPYVVGTYDEVQDAALVAVGTFIIDTETANKEAVADLETAKQEAIENLEAEGLQPEIVDVS